MSKIAWLVGGFIGCLALLGLVGGVYVFRYLKQPFGIISYEDGSGTGVEVTPTGESTSFVINDAGKALPYGTYEMKLKGGMTLTIYKNDKGNATVNEKQGLITIYADRNVIDCYFDDN